MLTQAYAERYWVTFATSSDAARELMRESFTATDTRLPPLGASGSAFASHQVHGLYDLLYAEAGPVTVNPARFRSDEARIQVMARIAGILGDLEMAIRHELGADQIPPKTRPPRGQHRIAPYQSVPAPPLPAPQRARRSGERVHRA